MDAKISIHRILIVTVVILFNTAIAWTEEPGLPPLPETLSLNDVLQLASEQNLTVRRTAEETEIAAGKITESYAAALPKLGAGAECLYVSDTISRGENEQTELSLTLTQPVYRGGAVKAGLRAAKLYSQYAETSLSDARLDIVQQAGVSYYDVLLAKADLRVAEEAVELAAYDLKMVMGRKAQGTATNLEVSRARERLSSNRADRIQADNNMSIAKMRLLTLLGMPVSTPIDITGELTFAPQEIQLEEDIAIAEKRRPDLKGLELQADMQRENIIAVEAERGVSVNIVGGYTQIKPASPLDNGFEEEYYGGVTVSFPIFEGGLTRGKKHQEKARLRQAEVDIRRKKEDILLNMHEAAANLRAAELMVKAREDNLQQAREALDLARNGYKIGVSSQLDVLTAQLSFTEASREYSRAVYSHNVHKINFKRARGTLLDEIHPKA